MSGNYDVWQGLYFISTSILIFGLAILILLSFRLYKYLKAQDELIDQNAASGFLDQTLDIFKRSILWVIGYGGKAREITPISEVKSGGGVEER